MGFGDVISVVYFFYRMFYVYYVIREDDLILSYLYDD